MIRIVELVVEGEGGAVKKIKVIRGGKIVTKNVNVAKLPKRMTMKQRLALKKARIKSHTARAKKKRKKSMKRRARIPVTVQARDAIFAAKRRQLARNEQIEWNSIEGADDLFLVETDFELVDLDGNYYDIEQGFLVDIYENEDEEILIDIYDTDGNIYMEDIFVSLDVVITLFDTGILTLVDEVVDPQIDDLEY